ncbi:hypothetical protein [uncultured Gimesia sp.]|uniref:hypothetical protein n=1 Tax=uncultured Gimesia sp. TaxID=1678688 RepID=UPI00262594AD|nr:hypothetical protein [uncultured Gimesia sp.]
MNFGYLILSIAFLLTVAAVNHQGWFLLLLWPAFSFGLVAAGYLFLGPCVFGKSERGLLSPLNQFLLLPYLVYLSAIWYLLRNLRLTSLQRSSFSADDCYPENYLMALSM